MEFSQAILEGMYKEIPEDICGEISLRTSERIPENNSQFTKESQEKLLHESLNSGRNPVEISNGIPEIFVLQHLLRNS